MPFRSSESMLRKSDSSTGKAIASTEGALARCTELEAEIAELRVAYEQYFLGNERTPPTKQHNDLKKALRDLKGQFIKSTSAKFRVNNLTQKFATYERLWLRTLQEIENGTYKRDLFKAKRHKGAADQKQKANDEFHIDEDFDTDEDLDSAMEQAASAVTKPSTGVAPAIAPASGKSGIAPAIAPASGKSGSAPAIAPASGKSGIAPAIAPTGKSGAFPAASPSQVQAKPSGPPKITAPGAAPARQPAAARGGAGGGEGNLSDQKVKAIYDAYVMAKKRCGEDTRGLSLDSVSKTLRSQVPALMKQHGAKSVEFKVVIKDGKAVLRALPKV